MCGVAKYFVDQRRGCLRSEFRRAVGGEDYNRSIPGPGGKLSIKSPLGYSPAHRETVRELGLGPSKCKRKAKEWRSRWAHA